jgi:glycosyltransferase involved in cell wall biosynthesis
VSVYSSAKTASPAVIRLVPELRASHLDRHANGTPALLLFLAVNSDFGSSELPVGVQRVSFGGAVCRLLATRISDIELPEPLWMRFLPRHAVLAAAAFLGGCLRRRRRRFSTYAMENNELARLIGGRHVLPRPLVTLAGLVIGSYARLVFSRIAYASESSRSLYSALPFVSRIDSCVIDELPSALVTDDTVVVAGSAVFVGALEERKGIRHLRRAWEAVERQRPEATLSIIGSGPLAQEVQAWAADSPRSRLWVGHSTRSEVLARLEGSSVLVAPSVPDGRWREQIGLPIKEALSRGLTIVTTDQTGLAPWLASEGHHVLPLGRASTLERELSRALVEALERPLPRSRVRASLPRIDGRLRSDAWLHRANEPTRQRAEAPHDIAT